MSYKIDDGEMELLREAKRTHDWTILPTWKLKYLYQKFVAFPANDLGAVKEIANLAKENNAIKVQPNFDQVKEIFSEA